MESEGMTAAMAMITPDMLKRRVIWDAIEDPLKACTLLGMLGMGDDGDRAESEASQARLANVGLLIPLLTEFSKWLSSLATMIQVEGQDVNQEFVDQMSLMFFSIVQSAVIASTSVMVDLGLLEVNIANAPEGFSP